MFPPSGQLAETGTRCETGRKDSQKGIERIRDHSVPIAELGSQRKITVVAVAPTIVLNQDRFESHQRLSRAVSPASLQMFDSRVACHVDRDYPSRHTCGGVGAP
jgi:hypothetical protein